MSKNLPSSWSRTKKKWKELNPPDKDGNYICWICKQTVPSDVMTIDHVAPLELYPEYAEDFRNMRPAHEICNQVRGGSRIISKYGSTSRLRKRKSSWGKR